MKWAVEIEKTSLESRMLRDLLASLGFTVLDTVVCPSFTSREMEECSTAVDAFALAKRVRAAMHGAARIDAEFQLGSVLDLSCNPPSRYGYIECRCGTATASGYTATISVGPPAGLNEREKELWHQQQAEREYQAELERLRARLEPAFFDKRAEKVLDLLSESEPTGATLYKIYELAEGHPNNRRSFHARFGISADKFLRFKDAVHNPVVTGDWARHAYDDIPKSTQPMSKTEAEHFIRQLAAKWLDGVRRSR